MSVIEILEELGDGEWEKGGRPYEFKATMNSAMMGVLEKELGDMPTDAPWDRKALRLETGLFNFEVNDQFAAGVIHVEVAARGDNDGG